MFDRGTVIGGWTVDELLHQGSMATTFRVQREGVPSPHVLKLLFLRDPAFQERLRRAADVLITVRHPNLVSVVELVEHEGMQGIVSRFVEGTDLATWSATEQRPLTAVIKVFRQLTQGLRAAHDHGLVHRNLKPAKVLIDLTGRPHVHDFMLGKVLATSPEDAVTQLGTTFGTPQYMAPEQFRGAAGVDERADLFSLGCLLFELVAGRRAFEGQGLMEIYQNVSQGVRDDLTTVRSDVPPALERLVRDLTAPDPADRPDSARAVIDRLSEPELRALLSPSFSTATPVAALTVTPEPLDPIITLRQGAVREGSAPLDMNHRLEAGQILETDEGQVAVQFGERSVFRVAPHSRLQLLRLDEQSIELAIDGVVDVDLVKRAPGQSFIVHAGDRRVVVRGTAFRVDHQNEHLDVSCLRGKVAVSDGALEVQVPSGQRFESGQEDWQVAALRSLPMTAEELAALERAMQLPMLDRWGERAELLGATSIIEVEAAPAQAIAVDDAVAVLDHLGIGKAHIVGASMGGFIGQTVAIEFPDRVLSLTSMMSSTGNMAVGQADPEVWASIAAVSPTNREEVIEQAVVAFNIAGSPAYEKDEDAIRARAGLAYDRCYDPVGVMRQSLATIASGDRTAALAKLSVPTLIIHGEADRLCNVSGGEATAAAIPGAQLVTFPGMGHDMPKELWPEFARLIAMQVAS